MLLNRDPKKYRPLFGLKSFPSFLLGPRRPSNEALYKAVQRVESGYYKGSDKTFSRVISYLKSGNHPKLSAINIPEDVFEKHDEFIKNTPQTIYELWTSTIVGIEAGADLSLPKTKMWSSFLANQNTWQELNISKDANGAISILQSLEFSQAKSIQRALSLLDTSQADGPRGIPDEILEYSALLFVVACFDADLNDAGLGTADGRSMFELFLPKVVDDKMEPPLRQWMKYVQALLKVETQNETSDILLNFQAHPEREGKRLWQFSGAYEASEAANKKPYLPSHAQFDKMIKEAMSHIAEDNNQKAECLFFSLKVSSLCTTFLHNTFRELDEVVTKKDRMMLFDDFPYFYQIAKETKGPVQAVANTGR